DIFMGRGDMVARCVLDHGELAKDVTWIQKREDRFLLIRRRRRDLNDPDLEEKQLVAWIALHVDALPASYLEHPGHFQDQLHLGRGHDVQHPKPLEVPNLGMRRHEPEYTPGRPPGQATPAPAC